MSKKDTQLAKAFDATSLAGKLIDLNDQQMSEFVDHIVDESRLLKNIRVEKVTTPTGFLPVLEADGEFLKP